MPYHARNEDSAIVVTPGTVIDVEQLLFKSDEFYPLGIPIAQTFVALRSGDISKISVIIQATGTPNAPIILELRTTDGTGKPTATVLGSVSKNYGDLVSPNDYTDFVFSSPITGITADTKYAIVLRTNASVGGYEFRFKETKVYTSGDWYDFNDPNWELDDSLSLTFKIYLDVTQADVINEGILKQNLLVESGIKIDGRDISEDGIKIDDHENLKHTQNTDSALRTDKLTVDESGNAVAVGTVQTIKILTPEIKTDTSEATDLNIVTGVQKTLVLATSVYNDIIIQAYNLRAGITPPSYVAFQDSIFAASFINGQSDIVYGSFEIPHDYKEGTELEVHLHWSPSSTDTGNCVWNFKYSITNSETGTFGTETLITMTQAGSGTVNKHQYVTGSATISGTGRKIGDICVFALSRPTGDAFTGDAFLHSVGVHYQVDTMGSRQQKSKT